jgi:hypothetical protein
MTVLASTLPSNDGYVAAAYVVFFVLLLAYLTIMGIRLSRMERKLKEMHEGAPVESEPSGEQGPGVEQARGGADEERALGGDQAPPGETRAQELV